MCDATEHHWAAVAFGAAPFPDDYGVPKRYCSSIGLRSRSGVYYSKRSVGTDLLAEAHDLAEPDRGIDEIRCAGPSTPERDD